MKRKSKTVRLLVNFFNVEAYAAYDEMICRLAEDGLLLTPVAKPRLIERLEFRTDLPRGQKKLLYVEIARLLKSGNFVFRRPYCKNDLFRWLTDPRHSNLEEKFQTIQRAVNEQLLLWID